MLPSAKLMAAMGRFNAALAAAGVLVMGDGLTPFARVVPGPFAAVGELVAGFWLWEVRDLDEAVAWVRRCPNPMPGPSEIEKRPLYELADLRRDEAVPGGNG